MKTDQPFHGVSAPVRKGIFRESKRKFPLVTRREYERTIRCLWTGTHREEMYLALDVAEGFTRFRDRSSWSLYESLVMSAPHWDTLDWIATRLAGPLVMEDRSLENRLVSWSRSENLWVRRASLLAHLKHGQQTNTGLLADTVLRLAEDDEFFIRKAIGWVLRNYARTNPYWVRGFVRNHQGLLSALSAREALRNL